LLDITPNGYFMQGHLKEYIYAGPPRSVEELVTRLKK
jgi:hypothetical protein